MNKEEHLKLLAIAFFDNLEYMDACEYGSIGLDFKRPFGSSYVQGDILEICKVEPEMPEDGEMYYSKEQEEYADELYQELPQYLKDKIKPLIK